MADEDKKLEPEQLKAKTNGKPKADEKPKAIEEADEEDTEGLVKMHKDGNNLYVHPTTVEAHKTAGWKVA